MELGRELLGRWGYRRVDELVWVKTDALQRLMRSGRTGHWLNHSKEHCLVGIKGAPALNRRVGRAPPAAAPVAAGEPNLRQSALVCRRRRRNHCN